MKAYEAALPRAAKANDETALLALLGTLAAAYESELGNPELAIERNQQILELAPKDPEAVGALERLYVATGRFADLLAVYDKKLELAKSKDEELSIRFKLAGLYEDEIKQPDKAVAALSGDPQAGSEADAGAGGARSDLPAARTLEGAGADDRSGDRSLHRHGRGRRAEVPARRDPRAAPRRRRRRGRSRTARRSRWSPTHVGARTALQAYLSSADPELQQAAVEELEPIYESTNDLRAPRRGAADQARAREEDRQARRAAAAHRQAGRSAGERRSGLGGVHRAPSPRARRRRRRARRWRTWPTSSTTGSRWSRCTRRRCRPRARRSCRRRWSASCCWSSPSPTTRSWAQSERAVEYFRRAQSIQPEDASALVALERLYTRTERWSDLVDTLLKKAQLVTDAAEREEIRDPHRHRLGGDAGERRAGDRRLERRAAGQPVERAGAARARSPLPRARRVPRAGRQPAAAADAGRGRRRRDGRRCSGGSARCASRSSISWAPRSTPTRKILKLEPEHRETIAALERILPRPRSTSSTPRSCSSRSTRSAATGRASSASTRSRRATRPIPSRRSRSIARSPTATRSASTIRGAPTRRSAGRWPRIRRTPRCRPPSSGWRARSTSWTIWSLATGGSSPASPIPSARTRSITRSRASARSTWATIGRRRPPTAPRWRSGRAISRRPTRSSSSTCAAATTPNLVQLLQRKAEIVDGPAEKKALYYRAAQLYEEVLEDLESVGRRCSSTCSPSTTPTARRSISWSGSTSASGAGTI